MGGDAWSLEGSPISSMLISTRLQGARLTAPHLRLGCIMATTDMSPRHVPLHEYVHSHVLTEDSTFGK